MAISTNMLRPGGISGLLDYQQAMSRRDYEIEMMRRQMQNQAPFSQDYRPQEITAVKLEPKPNKTLLLLEI